MVTVVAVVPGWSMTSVVPGLTVLVVGDAAWIPFYATMVSLKGATHLVPQVDKVYRALLERTLPYLAGETAEPPLPADVLIEPPEADTAPDQPDRIDVKQQRRGATLLAHLRVEHMSDAERQRELLHPLRMLVQQVPEIGRRLPGQCQRQKHGRRRDVSRAAAGRSLEVLEKAQHRTRGLRLVLAAAHFNRVRRCIVLHLDTRLKVILP